ncbi:D-aminoacyl-tRNA deacylase [Candidatus Margulisiibacteriota bacterium]
MKAVIQRVNSASIHIEDKLYSKIGPGLLVLLGINHTDTEKEVEFITEKLINLRIFEDDNDKMNLSVKDIEGEIMVVSQFTLYGSCQKGRRPSFDQAARPETAIPIYENFVNKLKAIYNNKIQTGKFGAMMKINLENNGPVTFILER